MSKFSKIMEDAIEKARAVKCELPVYHEGLKEMLELLEEEVDVVGDEVQSG